MCSGERPLPDQGAKDLAEQLSLLQSVMSANATTAVTEPLVRIRAHLIGIIALQSMTVREKPMDAVDLDTAFNHRGDGYQVPVRQQQQRKRRGGGCQ